MKKRIACAIAAVLVASIGVAAPAEVHDDQPANVVLARDTGWGGT